MSLKLNLGQESESQNVKPQNVKCKSAYFAKNLLHFNVVYFSTKKSVCSILTAKLR